jgi:hypothetical protein
VFGQVDHVRLYGKDFKIKLEHTGFKVEYIDMWNRLAKEEREIYRFLVMNLFTLLRRTEACCRQAIKQTPIFQKLVFSAKP